MEEVPVLLWRAPEREATMGRIWGHVPVVSRAKSLVRESKGEAPMKLEYM